MNIREVARLAKVSTATVSRTINGSDKVTPETKERVQRAIEQLKFYPNTWARALGSGRSSLYGLIISDITNPFFPELVKSFEDIAVQYGQDVLVANTNYDPARIELCVTRMLQRKVDGVAIMTSEMDARLITEFQSREIPLVFLDTGKAEALTSNIVVDYAAGVDAAVEHIVELGHTKIAFISGPMMLRSARVRREAFAGCLERRGIGAGHRGGRQPPGGRRTPGDGADAGAEGAADGGAGVERYDGDWGAGGDPRAGIAGARGYFDCGIRRYSDQRVHAAGADDGAAVAGRNCAAWRFGRCTASGRMAGRARSTRCGRRWWCGNRQDLRRGSGLTGSGRAPRWRGSESGWPWFTTCTGPAPERRFADATQSFLSCSARDRARLRVPVGSHSDGQRFADCGGAAKAQHCG